MPHYLLSTVNNDTGRFVAAAIIPARSQQEAVRQALSLGIDPDQVDMMARTIRVESLPPDEYIGCLMGQARTRALERWFGLST